MNHNTSKMLDTNTKESQTSDCNTLGKLGKLPDPLGWTLNYLSSGIAVPYPSHCWGSLISDCSCYYLFMPPSGMFVTSKRAPYFLLPCLIKMYNGIIIKLLKNYTYVYTSLIDYSFFIILDYRTYHLCFLVLFSREVTFLLKIYSL